MLILHILAAISGIASSTIRNISIFKKEVPNRRMQKAVWASLLVLGITGFGLLFAKPVLIHSPEFLVKMFFVGALSVAEVYLFWKPTVWAGFASFFSWYFSFFWQGLERIQLSHPEILGFYLGVIFLSFLAGRKYGYT